MGVLVAGENWSPGHVRKGSRICRPCATQRSQEWARANPAVARACRKRARRTLAGRYNTAKSHAKLNGKAWTLTREEFAAVCNKPCVYCQSTDRETGVGLDRIENREGYTAGNVVPCCGDCNKTRGDRYTYLEMLFILGPAVRAVHERRRACSAATVVSHSA